jgi:hypothetical protein
MRSSSQASEPLDLETGLPTTPADVVALRRIRGDRWLSTEDYLRAEARLPSLPRAALRARKRAGGAEPFRLE